MQRRLKNTDKILNTNDKIQTNHKIKMTYSKHTKKHSNGVLKPQENKLREENAQTSDVSCNSDNSTTFYTTLTLTKTNQ